MGLFLIFNLSVRWAKATDPILSITNLLWLLLIFPVVISVEKAKRTSRATAGATLTAELAATSRLKLLAESVLLIWDL